MDVSQAKIGKIVYWPNQNIKGAYSSGVILEIDGNTAWIEQSNKTEIDYPIDKLLEEDPGFAPTRTQVAQTQAQTAEDLKNTTIMATMSPMVIVVMGRIYNQLPGSVRPFTDLTASQQVNLISALSGVSVDQIQKYASSPDLVMLSVLDGLKQNLFKKNTFAPF